MGGQLRVTGEVVMVSQRTFLIMLGTESGEPGR